MAEDFHEMDEKEIEVAMSRFFSITHGEYLRDVLNCFAEKRGYAQEYIYIGFCDDSDDEEDEENNDPFLKLDDKHVLIEQDASISFTGKDEFAYLDFSTFYKYMEEEVKDLVKRRRENADLLNLLAKVKEGLGL
ncbi:hypothetical protein [Lactiplantibacillus herbarum]|uniref:hypothetical protein n=1 Tax=Lactiplantibacillus herbarum TaxID=1670446 RepID=UPI00064E4E14|nr:hypothetical protein [Lactiplantibacillus herbarum]